jgi:hypothetical protein
MARPRSLTVIAGLALAQGIIGGLAGLLWLQIVSIFDEGNGTVSSLLVMIAEAKGWFLIALALMYVLFAAGVWQVRRWAWPVGLLVSVLTLLYLFSVLLRGGSVVAVVLWLIVPVIMISYLLSPTGRQAFGQDSGPSRPLH